MTQTELEKAWAKLKSSGTYRSYLKPNVNYWPHQHECAWNQLYEIERWCYNNLKGRNWRNVGNTFAFKRKADYAVFLLRWS